MSFNRHLLCWRQCASNVQGNKHPSSYLYIAWCQYKRDNTLYLFVCKIHHAVIKRKIISCVNISASLSILLGDIIYALLILRSPIIKKKLITFLWTHVCVCPRVAGCGNFQRIVVCSSSQQKSHFRCRPSSSTVSTSTATVEGLLQNTYKLLLLVFRIVQRILRTNVTEDTRKNLVEMLCQFLVDWTSFQNLRPLIWIS